MTSNLYEFNFWVYDTNFRLSVTLDNIGRALCGFMIIAISPTLLLRYETTFPFFYFLAFVYCAMAESRSCIHCLPVGYPRNKLHEVLPVAYPRNKQQTARTLPCDWVRKRHLELSEDLFISKQFKRFVFILTLVHDLIFQ